MDAFFIEFKNTIKKLTEQRQKAAARKPIITRREVKEDKGLLTNLQKSLREGLKNPKGTIKGTITQRKLPPPLPGRKPIFKK